MLSLHKYTFKFPQKKIQHVHYITPGSQRYHTVPLHVSTGKNQVLLFWKEEPCIKHKNLVTETILLEDAIYIGNLMNMPIVIVLDQKDDTYDLYYIRNNCNEITKCPKKKKYTS
jgi:hypothetical protein